MPLDDEHMRSLMKMLETLASECEENGHILTTTHESQSFTAKKFYALAYRLRFASKALKP